MRRAGTIEPRTGLISAVPTGVDAPTLPADYSVYAIVPFDGVLWVWSANSGGTWRIDRWDTAYDVTNIPVTSGAENEGEPVDDATMRPRAYVARGNLYATSSVGTRRIESASSTATQEAGARPPLTVTAFAIDGGRAIDQDSYVQYAAVIRSKANEIVVRSAPSTPYTLKQTAYTLADMGVTVTLDTARTGTSAGDVLEVYRSRQSTTAPPDAELYLVAEHTITISEISAAEVTVIDSVVDVDLGAALYTNPSQEGALRANGIPPRCADIAEYAGSVFFGDARAPHRLLARLVEIAGYETAMTCVADITSGSNTVTNFSTGGIAAEVGQYIWGQSTRYFPAGTKITSVSGSTITVSNNAVADGLNADLYRSRRDGIGYWRRTATITDSSNQITVHTSTMITVGMVISDAVDPSNPTWSGSNHFPQGTTVTAITGSGPYTITLSNAATGSGSKLVGFHDTVTITTDADTVTLYAMDDSSPDNTFQVFVSADAEYERDRTTQSLVQTLYETEATDIDFPRLIYVQQYHGTTRVGEDWPTGQLVLEERRSAGRSFTLDCTQEDAWFPAADGLASESETYSLMWSKTDEPEHVPAQNYINIGDQNKRTLRVVPTRDALYVFKADGIWRLSGYNENWRIDPIDPDHDGGAAILLHPEAVTQLDGHIYAWTTAGVVRVSDEGIVPVSDPLIGNLLGEVEGRLQRYPASFGAWMVADQPNNEILLGVPATNGENAAEYVYVFSTKTQAWTRWATGSIQCATYDRSRSRFYFGTTGTGHLDFANTETWNIARLKDSEDAYTYYDGPVDIYSSITGLGEAGGVSVLTYTVLTSQATAGSVYVPQVGDIWVVDNAPDVETTVASISSSPSGGSTIYTVTLDRLIDEGLSAPGDVDGVLAYNRIRADVKWTTRFAGDPLGMAFWREGSLRWETAPSVSFSAVWSSDQVSTEEAVSLTANTQKVQRIWVPQEYACASAINLEMRMLGAWRMQGLSLVFDGYEEPELVPL